MELKQHELDVHDIVPNVEELKPYSCSYCDKRFTTRGKCNLHMETHSKVFGQLYGEFYVFHECLGDFFFMLFFRNVIINVPNATKDFIVVIC